MRVTPQCQQAVRLDGLQSAGTATHSLDPLWNVATGEARRQSHAGRGQNVLEVVLAQESGFHRDISGGSLQGGANAADGELGILRRQLPVSLSREFPSHPLAVAKLVVDAIPVSIVAVDHRHAVRGKIVVEEK